MSIKLMILFMMPKLGLALGVDFLDQKAMSYVVQVVKSSLAHRKSGQSARRNDFIDLIIEGMKNKSGKSMTKDEDSSQFEKDAELKLDDDKLSSMSDAEWEKILLGNALVLFFAGFDTVSTVMQNVMWYFATQPLEQEKVRQEILEAMEKEEVTADEQRLDYTTVMNLPVLDMFVHEAMRCYGLSFIERKCSKDYLVPGTDFVVPKGMIVQLAGSGFLKDKKYFPNPEEFNLENFSAEAKAGRPPMSYLVFGQVKGFL